ncbi:type VI secretion system Vgr family protein [Paracoccus cavernae]
MDRLGRLTTALGPDVLVLLRFDGTEQLNDLFEYRVEALATRSDLDFDALVGTHATVEIEGREGIRAFDGIVTQARWAGVGENGHRYDLVLRPWFWLAGRRRNQRIFHNKTVVQILQELLSDYASLGDPALELKLGGDYQPLEYTVQYRESDLDFARRQMERAGISFHFRHAAGSHTLILTDDVLAHDSIGEIGLGFIRGDWMLELVRTCPRHGEYLEPLWQRYDRFERHDVAFRLAESARDNTGHSRLTMARSATAYDHWVGARLSGKKQQANWLDQFGLQAAAKFCGALGSLVAQRESGAHGASDLSDLDHADLGFGLARAGKGAICGFLSEHQEGHSPEIGQKRVFGALYSLLTGDACPKAYHPLKQILREHIGSSWPLGPGAELLGEPVLERRWTSIGALAHLLKMDAPALRERLGAERTELARHKPDDWALHELEKAGPFLSDLTNGLSDDQFCESLSLNPKLFQDMRDCSFLDGARGRHGRGWDLLAGQAIVERLLLGAQQVGRLSSEWLPLEQAADHHGCSTRELVERIGDGRLTWIGRYSKQTGFAAILVNIAGLDGREISAETLALSQGLTFSEMLSFFRKGHSPAEIARRETGRKDRIMLTPVQVAAFHENFVSFRRLALAHRLPWEALDQRLEELGIVPVEGYLRIYRRSETDPLLHDEAERRP